MSGQAGASAGAPGGGVRVTVPVSLAPDEAARDLAPRLRALIDEAAPASSGDAHPDGSGTHADPAITPRRVPVVTIDGYSGSGKSTLAAALARLLPGWQVLHLDDWYPGWDGLAAGTQVARRICEDLRAGHCERDDAPSFGQRLQQGRLESLRQDRWIHEGRSRQAGTDLVCAHSTGC